MKFSRKMRHMIILKVTKKPGSRRTLSLEDIFFEKPHPPAVLGLSLYQRVLATQYLNSWS